jgi:hypothetical protein
MNQTQATAPLLMLASRTFMFLFFQAIIAGIFLISGSSSPWHSSQAWWTFSVICTNAICICLLVFLLRKEGTAYFKVFGFEKKGWWKDLLICLGMLALAGPIASLPNTLLANALFGSSEAVGKMFFQPLPQWAIIISFLFPLTHIFAELPVYFGYAMPRVEKQMNNGWAAWVISSLFLALQHGALPFVPEPKFILWRVGMFVPFALYIGLCIKIRPRLLPYMMIGHGLLDTMLVVMIPVLKP